jgi:hypothetical protein
MGTERSYTVLEWEAHCWFENRLSAGDSCIRAGIKVARRWSSLSVEFIEHLMGVDNG